ncbi:hypothetical protein PIROE2DRAFT_63549 [Piromyces sp. E2]|nr:hypothetical protein PIROE2DRAFT_63549 [Piromyces sp. E2]|eukprot:OUM59794.1 hypothetical protein PIROE2DRAFT_63549 [Piromyces sp. E2]
MKLNGDVLLKIYNEFLNSDIETKSALRQACPFIYRNYYDPRFVEINDAILTSFFTYLLSKPQQIPSTQQTNTTNSFTSTTTSSPPPTNTTNSFTSPSPSPSSPPPPPIFKEFQKTFSSFQNLRFQNVSSSCVSNFFIVILEEFNRHPNRMHELYSFFHPKPRIDNPSRQIRSHDPLNNHEIQKEKIPAKTRKTVTPTTTTTTTTTIKKVIPFFLLYNTTDSQKIIIRSILKLAMEQGLQHHKELSFEDFTIQQIIALEGLFESFYNILCGKLARLLHFKSNFSHLQNFELYNCQCNYTILVPFSSHLTTIKVIDSQVRMIIDGEQCPRLKRLIVDEEASLKLVGRKRSDFDQLEVLQLRNINFFETPQLPWFSHIKSLRINNYPSVNVTLPTMNNLQELFVQDSQLCDQIRIKPQPNLKFLRLWNYHSCLGLVDTDIQYIYSNYGSNTTLSTPYTHHRFSTSSTSSTSSTLSHQSCSSFTSATSSSSSSSSFTSSSTTTMISETDSFIIDYPTYFPKVEYLRIGYCSDLFFIKQISQRIAMMTTKYPSTSLSTTSNPDLRNPVHLPPPLPPPPLPTKKKLRRFNLLFPNLKTLVIERSCDLVDYLKWFVPTLSLLTTLIFKDCHWGGNGMVPLENINLNQERTTTTSSGIVSSSSSSFSSGGINGVTRTIIENEKRNEEKGKKGGEGEEGVEEEEEEQEQEKIEEMLLRSNNLQAVLQKMRFPNTLSEIIFINCSQELTEFIKKVLTSRHLFLKYNDIQCNEQQLKKWWAMF